MTVSVVSLRFCLFLSHCCGFVVIPILSLLTQESRGNGLLFGLGHWGSSEKNGPAGFHGRGIHGSNTPKPWIFGSMVTGFRYVFLEGKRRELAGVWIASWKVWIATSRQFRPQAVLRSGAGSEVP